MNARRRHFFRRDFFVRKKKMSAANGILLPIANYFSTTEEKVFHVIKCILALLFLIACDRILKAHEQNEGRRHKSRSKSKAEEEEEEEDADFPNAQPKGDLTRKELKQFDGNDVDRTKPILLACKGTIFDVSKGRDFYGPGICVFFLKSCISDSSNINKEDRITVFAGATRLWRLRK